MADSSLRAREAHVDRIQASYGYNREDAEKVFEIMQLRSLETLFGFGCGALAAYKVTPVQRELSRSLRIFRKPWLRYPMQMAAFGAAFYVGIQLPARAIRKITPTNLFSTKRDSGIDKDTYKGETDFVSRFRLFEDSSQPTKEEDMLNYLSMYAKDPLTKPELVDQMMQNMLKKKDIVSKFQVKRSGKDEDDYFWAMGKIHGLENIAFVDTDALIATGGNPVAIQKLVNGLDKSSIPKIGSYDELCERTQTAMLEYRAAVDKLPLNPSDRKKLLSLPWYMSKRAENPVPRRGQAEYELFTELTGRDWYDDADVKFDEETKITEFDYENYIKPELLNGVDTNSQEFKDFIKMANFTSKTRHEKFQEQKAAFSALMPHLAGLSKDEMRALIHKMQNDSRKSAKAGEAGLDAHLDSVVNRDLERQLSKVSEKENYAVKNNYRHQSKTMRYADPKRMPVDENKVVDLLKNQHIFRHRLNKEVPNYTERIQNHQFENGVLSYLSNVAKGEMLDLVREVGINRNSMEFTSIQDVLEMESKYVHPSDRMFGKFLNAMFTPLDMTDYEDDFVSFAESQGELPLQNVQRLLAYAEEPWPQSDMTAGVAIPDEPPITASTPSMKEMFKDFYAVPEEEEIDFYGKEDGEDEYGDEDEEGEGEEEGGDYGEEDYGEEEEEVVWPPPSLLLADPLEDRYFKANENVRGQYSDVEI